MRAHAVNVLHRAGVLHGQLYERADSLCFSDGRHFLLAQDNTYRLVDFSQAKIHNCMGELAHERQPYHCDELTVALSHQKMAQEGRVFIPWNAF